MHFPVSLNLQPFMTQSQKPYIYDLFAVLVHVGHECWSGHYYCYVKNSNNMWYQVPQQK